MLRLRWRRGRSRAVCLVFSNTRFLTRYLANMKEVLQERTFTAFACLGRLCNRDSPSRLLKAVPLFCHIVGPCMTDRFSAKPKAEQNMQIPNLFVISLRSALHSTSHPLESEISHHSSSDIQP